MPVSPAVRMLALRLTDDEKARLDQLAAARNITLSYAIREGLKLYLGEFMERDRDPGKSKVRARAT